MQIFALLHTRLFRSCLFFLLPGCHPDDSQTQATVVGVLAFDIGTTFSSIPFFAFAVNFLKTILLIIPENLAGWRYRWTIEMRVDPKKGIFIFTSVEKTQSSTPSLTL
jgi:hypothetical protein